MYIYIVKYYHNNTSVTSHDKNLVFDRNKLHIDKNIIYSENYMNVSFLTVQNNSDKYGSEAEFEIINVHF